MSACDAEASFAVGRLVLAAAVAVAPVGSSSVAGFAPNCCWPVRNRPLEVEAVEASFAAAAAVVVGRAT